VRKIWLSFLCQIHQVYAETFPGDILFFSCSVNQKPFVVPTKRFEILEFVGTFMICSIVHDLFKVRVSIAIKQADEIEKLLCHKVGFSTTFGNLNYFGLIADLDARRSAQFCRRNFLFLWKHAVCLFSVAPHCGSC
jgi:hypothetical protein